MRAILKADIQRSNRGYLIPLAVGQGSNNAGRLYQVYSQMVNRVLGYPVGQREVMAVADLIRLTIQ